MLTTVVVVRPRDLKTLRWLADLKTLQPNSQGFVWACGETSVKISSLIRVESSLCIFYREQKRKTNRNFRTNHFRFRKFSKKQKTVQLNLHSIRDGAGVNKHFLHSMNTMHMGKVTKCGHLFETSRSYSTSIRRILLKFTTKEVVIVFIMHIDHQSI